MVILTNTTSGQRIELNTNFRGVTPDGKVVFRPDGSKPGRRFFNTYTQLYWDGVTENENGCPLLTVICGWKAEHRGRGPRKPRTPKPQPEPENVEQEQPQVEEPAVQIVNTDEPVRHKKFDMLCKMVKKGIAPYLWGPSGTGKSELAKQTAQALGLPFYMICKVSDVFELKGFADAEGRLVENDFYKSMKHGGLLLFDEMDCSNENALKAFNGAMAQRCFSFPVEGMVEAHPDFRVIGAGNSGGTGATEEYTASNMIDASTLNRFKYIFVDYDERIELKCAKGDKQLVDFIHLLRESAKRNGVSQILSYRNINHLVEGQEIGEPIEENIISSVLKEKSTDEVRMMCNGLNLDFATHPENKWLQALTKIYKNGVEVYR